MKRQDFYYELPEELIAQTPVTPRDHSRLMVVDRESGAITHRHFYNLCDILQYARDRFPGCEVQAAKRDGKNTEIKLSNRTELMFNAKGEPIDREKEPRDD